MRVALFEWSAGGHRPVYVRRFVDALRDDADLLLALPEATSEAIGDLGVETFSLGPPRPQLGPRLHRSSVARQELELLRQVAGLADQTLHLYGDHVLFHLARSPVLPHPVSLLLYHPRAHYRSLYGTRLPVVDQAVALAKEWAIGRWRARPDAGPIFALDEALAELWNRSAGARAYWLPEPPVAALPEAERPLREHGCVLYGALARRKGLALLARALTSGPTELRLTLAGVVDPAEYVVELEEHVRALRGAGVTVDVRAWPHSETEGLGVLASASCAVLPYPRHSGMSRVLVEACSVGTPVVTDNFGLLGHLVRRHNLGVTVDCADPSALREAVLSLSDLDRAAAYARSLRDFAARFSTERFRSALVRGLGLAPAEHPEAQERVLK